MDQLNPVISAQPLIAILKRLLLEVGEDFAVRLWDGSCLRSADTALPPRFTLICRNPEALRLLFLGQDSLRLAEAYLRNDLDIEGDLFAVVALKEHLQSLPMTWHQRLWNSLFWLLHHLRNTEVLPAYRRSVTRHTKQENSDAVTFHYDVSNDFYALWLDPAMVYSCAYFEQSGDDLEKAQQAKLEHICRKLMLQPGERLLDIGCGWGALILYAAKHHGVKAHGISLSHKQLELARVRIAQSGLADRVTVELLDYRDLDGKAQYDKIASVGMFEHVGLRNLPEYFASVRRLLKPAGLFLNHGITSVSGGWLASANTRFINRYIFPDGQLDTISNIQRAMEGEGFEIADVEALRRHYALTLRHWVERLERHHTEALRFVSEQTYRAWRLYMTASALQFEAGGIGVYQVLASAHADQASALPLTRRHLYC